MSRPIPKRESALRFYTFGREIFSRGKEARPLTAGGLRASSNNLWFSTNEKHFLARLSGSEYKLAVNVLSGFATR